MITVISQRGNKLSTLLKRELFHFHLSRVGMKFVVFSDFVEKLAVILRYLFRRYLSNRRKAGPAILVDFYAFFGFLQILLSMPRRCLKSSIGMNLGQKSAVKTSRLTLLFRKKSSPAKPEIFFIFCLAWNRDPSLLGISNALTEGVVQPFPSKALWFRIVQTLATHSHPGRFIMQKEWFVQECLHPERQNS